MFDGFKHITLERTMCLGTCPDFKVSIHWHGKVRYLGRMYVEETGVHRWQLEPSQIEAINRLIKKTNYFELKSTPQMWCTDMPSCITTVEMKDGRKREIDHYLQDEDEWPKALRYFERRLEEIIRLQPYVGENLDLMYE